MSQRTPNVLVIMQDQLRHDLVSGDLCSTPNFDRLAEQGMTFANAYTATGLCGPARASFLTGVYPHVHGVLNNVSGPDAINRNLPRDTPTIAEMVVPVGYRTGYVGKWHVGVEEQASERGFADVRLTDADTWDHPPASERTGDEYVEWTQHFRAGDPFAVFAPRRPPHPRLADRFPRAEVPLYTTRRVDETVLPARGVLDHCVDLLDRYAAGTEPFLLVASFLEPHWPYVLPERFASMYDPDSIEPWPNFADTFEGKPGANHALLEMCGVEDFTWKDWQPIVASYLGAASLVDDLMGRLIGHLDALGLGENTLVLATADHGDLAGSHRQFNKGSLMYEEVYRVPFVWRGPGVETGRCCEVPVSHVDVVPTILEMAGAPSPAVLHGRSLVDVLGGDETNWRDAVMAQAHGVEYGLYSQRMVRWGRYKLVYNSHDVRELYDLVDDPDEMHNLAAHPDHLDVRRDVEARLVELMFETSDPLRGTATNVLG